MFFLAYEWRIHQHITTPLRWQHIVPVQPQRVGVAYLWCAFDTNVVSELRKPRPHGGVVAWLESLDDAQLYVSAVTLGEIQAGFEMTREQDPVKAQQLEDWLALMAGAYNVLPMDAAAFTAWARLMHRKSDTLYEDAMIAATAKVHGLTIATRNVAEFQALGLKVFNPFEQA